MVARFQTEDFPQAENVHPKRQRFRRLAAQRTNSVLDKLRVLGNCANPYQYAYTEEEVSKMFAAIEAEARRVRALFAAQKRQRFSF